MLVLLQETSKDACPTDPLFQWPPRLGAIFRWYAAFWLEVSTTTLCFVFALIAYFAILPELADDKPVDNHDSSTNGLINAYKQMGGEI